MKFTEAMMSILMGFLWELPESNQKVGGIGDGELLDEQPRVINGVFSVSKDEKSQRLIIDVRNANMMFADPLLVDRPNPTNLGDLFLAEVEQRFEAKFDLNIFYYRIGYPFWNGCRNMYGAAVYHDPCHSIFACCVNFTFGLVPFGIYFPPGWHLFGCLVFLRKTEFRIQLE